MEEQILLLQQYPAIPNCFIALTNTGKLIKYIITPAAIDPQQIFDSKLNYLDNFTIAPNGNILLPTKEEKQLFIIDAHSFAVIRTQPFEFDFLTFLPLKQIYLAHSAREAGIVILNENLTIINTSNANSNIPIQGFTNSEETLLAILGYDQDFDYELFELSDDLQLEEVMTDFSNPSAIIFNNRNEFAVSSHTHMEYNRMYAPGQYEVLWKVFPNTKFYNAYMVLVNPDLIILGKQTHIYLIDIPSQTIKSAQQVTYNIIEGLYLNQEKDLLILILRNDILALPLNKIL